LSKLSRLLTNSRVANPKFVPQVYGPSDGPYAANPKKPEEAVQVKGMGEAEIDRWVSHYANAARNAVAAGFDGVEIHGANGYIVDQFLQSITNKRTDKYGGSIENRLRFPLRVLNAVCDAIGPERVGIRMSPFGIVQGMRETVPLDTFLPWARAIAAAQPRLAYVHAVTPRTYGTADLPENMVVETDDLEPVRQVFKQAKIPFISAGAYRPAGAVEVADQTGDLIAFGRYFICEPNNT
jgi:NADPH2 dehydrogenase